MDLATIAGIVMGITLISLSIMTGGSAGTFINIPSMLATIGGGIAATFISFPLKTLLNVVNVVKNTILHSDKSPVDTIRALTSYAEKARKEGMLALEDEAEAEEDEFLKKGLLLAVDGTEADLLNKIMRTEIESVADRHTLGQNVLRQMGAFFPAFGMIGTLIGLVAMLSQMNDPSKIGPGMAVAILTTFYGAFLANLFCLPMAEKLSVRSEKEIQRMELVIAGIMAIKEGDTPRVVEEKLKSFISPGERNMLDQGEDEE
ncbi:MAG: motility protein A [Candidatus Latescibacteria bacterium]|nr:motility protein A [bacterium]MBD3424470.1 motility protein A [Candidatus Latescibacterota bacterium]